MARLHRLFVGDDDQDMLYCELWFRIVGATNWTQQIITYPAPIYESVSPALSTPYLPIQPLADDTDYEWKRRLFNADNQFSDWKEGTFTTGI